VSVPAGKVVTVTDALAQVGANGTTGTLDVGAAVPIFVFSRTTAAADGGRFGFGLAALNAGDAVPAPSRGVFIAVTANGYDKLESDLLLTNISDAPSTVAVNLTDASGTSAGSRTVTVPPRATRILTNVWYTIAGFGADVGRVDVVPADGSAAVLATVLRHDNKTHDTDPLLPFVIPR
jgi:hypothetical protein